MRILGNIEHPVMKITVLHSNNRVMVKFETNLFEQTYKFREGSLVNNLEEAKRWVTPQVQEKILDVFNRMNRLKSQGENELLSGLGEDEFETII